MILGHVEFLEKNILLPHPVLLEALRGISSLTPESGDGEFSPNGREKYFTISTNATIPHSKAVFEAHKNYLDIHYCLDGGEHIDWAPVHTLSPRTEYNQDKDYTLFDPLPAASTCVMSPGTFAIFFPADAHMPKVSDGMNKTVKKVVVKITTNLLQ